MAANPSSPLPVPAPGRNSGTDSREKRSPRPMPKGQKMTHRSPANPSQSHGRKEISMPPTIIIGTTQASAIAQPVARPIPVSRNQPFRQGNPCALIGSNWRSSQIPFPHTRKAAGTRAWLYRPVVAKPRSQGPAPHAPPPTEPRSNRESRPQIAGRP